jgi:predicted DNA-binding antitoxin AbrB/MazE fold protein
MSEVITAVYEKGVLRPVKELLLEEHQTVMLRIISRESIVKETKGMFRIAPHVLKETAESEELLEMGE